MATRTLGYHDCPCRDCFDTAIGGTAKRPALCQDCKSAGCDATGRSECERSDAYGAESNPRRRTHRRRRRVKRNPAGVGIGTVAAWLGGLLAARYLATTYAPATAPGLDAGAGTLGLLVVGGPALRGGKGAALAAGAASFLFLRGAGRIMLAPASAAPFPVPPA